MFTGLIEEVGICRAREGAPGGARLLISASEGFAALQLGDSVAVDGCCLTVTAREGRVLGFDLLGETLSCTNLGALRPGSPVNLERALPAAGRLGGHFVQGHVDCTAALLAATEHGADLKLSFELPSAFAHYLAPKGSVAINGVSLTTAGVGEGSFHVWIIPHTRSATNLGALSVGAKANLEFDVLAKYVERMLPTR